MGTAQIETWGVRDSMGEYVRYYNPTNHIMVFTNEPGEAMKTTDSMTAFNIARIAREVYRRPNMQMYLMN